MKPLILEYAEKANGKPLDFSVVEYSPEQNLTVLKNSSIPAVQFMPLDTSTLTKSDGEGSSDADDQHLTLVNELRALFDTSTQTKTYTEDSDSDASYGSMVKDLKVLMDTATLTLNDTEMSDSDNDRMKAFGSLLDTQTLTETVETSDSDESR